jgi:ParB-like chromosome segregation protein Spo0J
MTASRTIRLDDLHLDSATQVRVSINESVVTTYTERMAGGVEFPAVVVFQDEGGLYLADGFHRCFAARRLGLTEIAADVRPGTEKDAVWFAFEANRAHGAPLTKGDTQREVTLALRMFPERTQREIAEQVGCHVSFVSAVYQKTTSREPVLRGQALATHKKREAVRALVQAGGLDSKEIAKQAQCSQSLVTEIRAEIELAHRPAVKSRKATQPEIDRIRRMAGEGYTTRQIVDSMNLKTARVRRIAVREGIDIRADRVVGRTHRPNPNRIISTIVMDAEQLTAASDMIKPAGIDRGQLPDWIRSLKKSRTAFSALIRRLEGYQ